MVLVHLQPVVIVIVCHAIATDGGVGGVLGHGLCLAGGTDVVDLPDILLPAGQYLDLFDSESETDVPSDSSDEELVEV